MEKSNVAKMEASDDGGERMGDPGPIRFTTSSAQSQPIIFPDFSIAIPHIKAAAIS